MSPRLPACLPFMTTQTATLTGISTVAIAVSDQDATKRLFEELGFETRFDADVNVDFRWIEMGPPGGGTTLSVVATTDALPTGVEAAGCSVFASTHWVLLGPGTGPRLSVVVVAPVST